MFWLLHIPTRIYRIRPFSSIHNGFHFDLKTKFDVFYRCCKTLFRIC